MYLIDLLAEVAAEELAKMREEEKKKRKEQYTAEKICKRESTKDPNTRKIDVIGVSHPLSDSATKKRKRGTDNVDNVPDLPPRKLKSKTRKQEPDNGNNSPPALPAKFKKMILKRAQGREVEEEVLVIQKKLTMSDVNVHHNCLSIPVKQMRNKFLRVKDVKFLRMKERGAGGRCSGIEAGMIEPQGRVKSLNLTRWVCPQSTGNDRTTHYILNGEGWKKLRSSNGLKKGDAVQLWAVRIGGKLCFVLVKLENSK